MPFYLVMSDGHGNIDELDELGKQVTADSAKDAAEEYVENNYADLDYPRRLDVFVKPHGSKAAAETWEVVVEDGPPIFSANKQEKP